ncbi:hypothetical protein [Rhizobium sp. SSA_523]|uniref:hypothetical protein n=1 Tax=Rhizobium sp. SSA_523 TaxID=2952477 RepID=UPI00209041BA|nr:hypothetical protein [Rhizobium sp. SSA_523]MCO5731711.1 hypothetical protein [Rhizobium sp. SSA_523]WKC22913.1 hypothetical protein QTJ18_18980 [Rhizobium sp. SSA_523]
MTSERIDIALEPQDLRVLQSCLDDIRRKRGLSSDEPETRSLAARMIELYQSGIRDPRELAQQVGV